MGTMTTFLSNEILDHILGNGTYTPPATIYLAAYTVAPTIAGGGTEVSGGSYARVAVSLGVASGRNAQNASAVSFAAATASWGTVVAIAYLDASTAGNMLGFASLTTSKTIASGDILTFPTGDLDFGLDQ